MSLGVINAASLGALRGASAGAAFSNGGGNKFSNFIGQLGGVLDRVNEVRGALERRPQTDGRFDLGRYVQLPAVRVETDNINRSITRTFLFLVGTLIVGAVLFRRRNNGYRKQRWKTQ